MQLVKGADPALHKKLMLETDPKAYKYMASCTDVASIDDKKELDEVLQVRSHFCAPCTWALHVCASH